MANEKDITEKMLFDAEDVFADILNVLLFSGREVVLPQTLAPTGQRTQLKIAGKIHEQERDVSKIWLVGGVRFALYGLENQTDIDKFMVLRVFSYDGASYKEQVVHSQSGNVEKWALYPAITVVLYFGNTRWNGPRTLKELLGTSITPDLEPFVNDYRLHIFEIAFLTPEEVAMFKSDFRIVADFFVQMRQNKEYVPGRETIVHVEETLKLMSVLTGDTKFEENANRIANEIAKKGGTVTMYDVLGRAEKKGHEEGLKEGKLKGHEEGLKEGELKGHEKGFKEGELMGRIKELFDLVLDGVLSLPVAAARANLSEQEFSRRAEEYRLSGI